MPLDIVKEVASSVTVTGASAFWPWTVSAMDKESRAANAARRFMMWLHLEGNCAERYEMQPACGKGIHAGTGENGWKGELFHILPHPYQNAVLGEGGEAVVVPGFVHFEII